MKRGIQYEGVSIMKMLLAILIVIISFNSCFSDELDDHYQNKGIGKHLKDEILSRDDLNLKGDVRSFLEYELSPSVVSFLDEGLELKRSNRYWNLSADTLLNEIWVDSIENCFSVYFNPQGDALKKKWWYAIEGHEDSQNTDIYTYNPDGNLVKIQEYFSSGQGGEKLRNERVFKHWNGRLVETNGIGRNFDGIKSKSNTTITYKGKEANLKTVETDIENGNVIRQLELIMISTGEIINPDNGRIIYSKEFDKSGNLLKMIEKDTAYSDYAYITEYSYDSNDNLIREVSFVGVGNSIGFKHYYYDDNNVLRLKMISEHEISEKKIYDFRGNIIEHSDFDYKDSLNRYNIEKYKYDEFGNLVNRKTNYKTKDGYRNEIINNFKYKYDHNNNWIEKISFDRDSLVSVVMRRDILYY